ncbi:hypothetical protein BDZ97DRAFT_2056354 [Flammula alnicola]|nr:hypothetical protein BDZ97DRAFT_2056354 [Flammula alnicola]
MFRRREANPQIGPYGRHRVQRAGREVKPHGRDGAFKGGGSMLILEEQEKARGLPASLEPSTEQEPWMFRSTLSSHASRSSETSRGRGRGGGGGGGGRGERETSSSSSLCFFAQGKFHFVCVANTSEGKSAHAGRSGKDEKVSREFEAQSVSRSRLRKRKKSACSFPWTEGDSTSTSSATWSLEDIQPISTPQPISYYQHSPAAEIWVWICVGGMQTQLSSHQGEGASDRIGAAAWNSRCDWEVKMRRWSRRERKKIGERHER